MVITVQGVGQNLYVSQAVATMSTMLALRKRKKTLVLQICNKTSDTVEEILRGKENTDAGIISNPNKGIDALLREVEDTRLTSDLFDAYCECIFETKNLLDIAQASPKKNAMPDFERACGKPLSVRQKAAQKEGISRADFKMLPMDMLLEEAQEVYDYIIIALTYCTENVLNYFNDYADTKILVVPQGKKRDVKIDNKDILIIPNYQDRSLFTAKKVATSYGCKKVFPIAYNIDYNDASELRNLFPFISANRSCKEDDDNFEWSKNVIALTDELTGEKEAMEEIPFFEMEDLLEGEFLDEAQTEIEPIENSEVAASAPSSKKRLFGKKEKPVAALEVYEEETVEESLDEEMVEGSLDEEMVEETAEETANEVPEIEVYEEVPKKKSFFKKKNNTISKEEEHEEDNEDVQTVEEVSLEKEENLPEEEVHSETKEDVQEMVMEPEDEKSKDNEDNTTGKTVNETRVEKETEEKSEGFDLMAFLEEE